MHARQAALARGLPSNPAPRPHPDFSDLQTFCFQLLLLHLLPGASVCAQLQADLPGRVLLTPATRSLQPTRRLQLVALLVYGFLKSN